MNAPLELNERELLALAERAEAATGPDRRLDTLVEIARNPERPWIIGNKPGRFPQEPIYGTFSDLWEWALDETREPPEIGAPRYTASLDAAMTLVPEGHMVAHLGQKDDGRWWAEVRRGFVTSFDKAFPVLDAATPALALTSACLRAIAAKGGRT